MVVDFSTLLGWHYWEKRERNVFKLKCSLRKNIYISRHEADFKDEFSLRRRCD